MAKIFGIQIGGKKEDINQMATTNTAAMLEVDTPAIKASTELGLQMVNSFAITYRFDGEKNLGEMGPPRHYVLDYDSLRARSWQAYLDSEIVQTVIRRFTTWVIGAGLKLNAEPQVEVLKTEGIDIDPEQFNDVTEARWKVYSNSKMSDVANQSNLNKIAATAFKNAIVGGDVLVVQRVVKGMLKHQLIDGAHVQTPLNFNFQGDWYINPETRNRVKHGVELGPNNEHVAYHVCLGYNDYLRIPARNKNGDLVAYLVYGLEYRLDNIRGIPLISAILETAKKMERYKEAVLGSAEERQKIAWFIAHVLGSSGENPLTKDILEASNYSDSSLADNLPEDKNGVQLSKDVALSYNKRLLNLPPGADLKSLESKNELYFKEFIEKNIELVCATIGIPPEVAMMKYDSNFSASRAALKDWEHTIKVNRKQFGVDFYQPSYNTWLQMQVLSNKISAPGFLKAVMEENIMAIEAYQFARFEGANVPHIDPLKEVEAERAKLGELAKDLPLTTLEAATEALNGGDATANMAQYSKEREKAKQLGIESTQPNNTKAP